MTERLVLVMGDIHGYHFAPEFLLNELNVRTRGGVETELDYAIQVGDWGWYHKGARFRQVKEDHNWRMSELGLEHFVGKYGLRKIFIPGNHEEWGNINEENRGKLLETPYGDWRCAPRGYYEKGILFVGGAYSVDRIANFFWKGQPPRPHHDRSYHGWWEQEELDDKGENEVWEIFQEHKHDIKLIVTHDCPQDILEEVWRHFNYKREKKTRTSTFLQRILDDLPNPSEVQWVFGHHHRYKDFVHHSGVRFTVLEDFDPTHPSCDWYKTLTLPA